jgi:hypothetical protein
MHSQYDNNNKHDSQLYMMNAPIKDRTYWVTTATTKTLPGVCDEHNAPKIILNHQTKCSCVTASKCLYRVIQELLKPLQATHCALTLSIAAPTKACKHAPLASALTPGLDA